jgi:hypothetical protein
VAGTLIIPNSFSTQSGNIPASEIDDDFTAVRDYVNNREVTIGLIAARPAAGVSGRWYLATDVNGGTLYVDTGVVWVQGGIVLAAGSGITITPGTASSVIAATAAVSGVSILDQVTTPTTMSGTVTETTVYTFSVPGGSLGSDGMLRLTLFGYGQLVSGGMTYRFKYGGTTFASYGGDDAFDVTSPHEIRFQLAALGATNSQVGRATILVSNSASPNGLASGASGVARGAGGVDSTVNQTLAVTVEQTVASASNNFTIEYAVLELLA